MIEQPANDQGKRIPTGAELTALDPTFRIDPYPVLAQLRRDEPAHYDGVINRWILTRHDDIERVLRDRTMSLDPHKAKDGTYMRLFLPPPGQAANMLFSDPPDHTRLRALVDKAFTPRAVERLAPRIRRIIGELLDPLTRAEGFDLIEAFARPGRRPDILTASSKLTAIVDGGLLGIHPRRCPMPARTPEELDVLFANAINASDIEAVIKLYEPGACLMPEPGEVASGTGAIRLALGGFLAMKPRIKLDVKKLAEAGDLALTTSKWVLEGIGADGKPARMEGQSAEVARRQPDGTWLFVIDNPYGLQ
jgi:ketosteroid isomerase-like protein